MLNDNVKWYVVYTYSGCEDKVKESLDKVIKKRKLTEIKEIRVPLRDFLELKKDGSIKNTKKKVFPNYIFIKMEMNDNIWLIIRNTSGVAGFVGSGARPVPLKEQEMLRLGIIDKGAELQINFEVGDMVKVVDGVWKGNKEKIESINIKNKSVIINIELFGKIVPVEIAITDIVKM